MAETMPEGGSPIRLLLVDALNLIRRVYAAQPGEDGPERAEGARVSSLQSLRRGLKETAPTHTACVFEGGGRSWRHKLHDGYKAGHAPMPGALEQALPGYRESFAEIGVESVSFASLEADDVIATIAAKARAAGATAIILSTDKAFLQLLPLGILVRDHFRGADFDAAHVDRKFGVRAEQLVDFLALTGDHGNGIPGVTGIGPKTAKDLLARFNSLAEILLSSAEVEGKVGERLRDEAEMAELSRKLVTLETDLELGINLADLRYQPRRPEALDSLAGGDPPLSDPD